MPNVDHSWLASLPRDEHAVEASQERLGFTAFLLPAPRDRVRFLVGPLLLEFNAADIIDIEELTLLDQPKQLTAIAVAVALRVAAPLLALYPAEMLSLSPLRDPMPFSLAIRPTALMLPPSPEYTAALAEYLERHDLET